MNPNERLGSGFLRFPASFFGSDVGKPSIAEPSRLASKTIKQYNVSLFSSLVIAQSSSTIEAWLIT
jgi:hypothetical protein